MKPLAQDELDQIRNSHTRIGTVCRRCHYRSHALDAGLWPCVFIRMVEQIRRDQSDIATLRALLGMTDATTVDNSALLNTRQVAELLNKPIGTLYQWRQRGVGPKSLKVGGSIRYRRLEVEKWLQTAAL